MSVESELSTYKGNKLEAFELLKMNLTVKIFIVLWMKILFGVDLFGLGEICEMYSGLCGQFF